MRLPVFLQTVFPPLLLPLSGWLLGLLVTRRMDRTRKNWLSAVSLFLTVLLMIALLLFRLSVRRFGFRASGNVALASVLVTLFCGVGIFLRAWSLYTRERLDAGEIAPYCVSGFLVELGALGAFHIVCLGAP